MHNSLDSLSVDRTHVEALLARVESAQLLDDDLSLIAHLIRSWLQLAKTLADKDVSLARLRKLLFGPSSGKRSTITREPVVSSSNVGATVTHCDQPVQVRTAQDPVDHAASQARPGHGRRPASSYSGAGQVTYSDPLLQPGSSCLDPHCTGSLFDTRRPDIFLRFIGQPVVGATRYHQSVPRIK